MKTHYGSALICLAMALLLCTSVSGELETDSPHVTVRVAGYNPLTNVYNISCQIPPATVGSQIDQLRFYAIDPVPQGYALNCSGGRACFHSASSSINWTLNAQNYTELVHTKELYHIYCEAQNYSAPVGSRNMAAEIHVDLRTDRNQGVPNIYVLKSEGVNMTMKCDAPPGMKNYYTSWFIRSRSGEIQLPELANKRIINLSLPKAGSGWDVLCRVFDRDDNLKMYQWDMPIEAFPSGPAYIPTIEGCVPGEPCTWVDPSGIPPNGSFHLTTLPDVTVLINEEPAGTTDANGSLTVSDIVPGIYNLVLRKDGFEELSTLLPIATNKTFVRNYTLELPQAPADPYNMCHTSLFSLPVNCTGGTVTFESSSGGCRTITCTGASNFTVKACNKPGNSNAQFFELTPQSANPAQLTVCIGNTCMKNEGFLRSGDYPICLGNATAPNITSNISFVSTSPAASTLSVPEGTAQRFNYTLSNPSNLTIARVWLLNGSQVASDTAAYMLNSSNGTYNITAQIISSKNNLTRTWILTVLPDNVTNTTNTTTNSTNGTSNTTQDVCYSSSYLIPANCTGGSIASDLLSGCRTITCTNGTSFMKVQACNKPGNSNAQFFEMYKQQQNGSAVSKICLGNTCISNSGYAKSTNFPICINTTSSNGTTNTTNTTNESSISFSSTVPAASSIAIAEPSDQVFSYTLANPSNLSTTSSWLLNGTAVGSASSYTFIGNYSTQGNWNVTVIVSSSLNTLSNTWILAVSDTNATNGTNSTPVCYNGMQNIPANCTGGNITTDTLSNSCRTITCSNGASSLRVLACNKPDSGTAQFFEMYKQQQNGSAVSKICLGNTCISNSGYAKSTNFPICI